MRTWGDSFENEFYELNVAGLVRKLPKVKINDELAIASFVMLGDTKLTESCALYLTNHPDFPKGDNDIDVVICPEAKAIPLVHVISRILGVDYIVARKSVKGYMVDPIVEKVESITTIGEQMLVLDKPDADKVKGKNVCIIDDVVSTGGSITSVEKLMKKAEANVVCKAAVLLEDAGYNNPDLVYLENLPIFNLKEIE